MDNRLKIVSGFLKNRSIKIPRGTETRPALILVRRVICDTLMPYIPKAHVLDLFAGTGAFVFELISRGAESAVANDMEPKMSASIGENARIFGIENQVVLFSDDYLKTAVHLGKLGRKFDIIILTPPFYGDYINPGLESIVKNNLLTDDGIVVAHYFKKDEVNREPVGLELWKSKAHGKSIMDFFKLKV